MTDIVTTIEQTAVKDWNAFLGGIHWLSTEVQAGVAAVEKVDPAVQVELQALFSDGEAAAATLAASATGGMTNVIASGADSIEVLLAELFQKAMGNAPAGQAATAAATAVLKQLGGAMVAAVPVAIAKLAAQVTTAAA